MEADDFLSLSSRFPLWPRYRLQTILQSPQYESEVYGDVNIADSVAILSEEENELTIFAVNRDLQEDCDFQCDLRQFEGWLGSRNMLFYIDDLLACNTEANPHCVAPVNAVNDSRLENGVLHSRFKKHSWNMIRFAKASKE